MHALAGTGLVKSSRRSTAGGRKPSLQGSTLGGQETAMVAVPDGPILAEMNDRCRILRSLRATLATRSQRSFGRNRAGGLAPMGLPRRRLGATHYPSEATGLSANTTSDEGPHRCYRQSISRRRAANNGFELSGPARILSSEIAELAGSAPASG
jgi:hypothetical protein